MEDSSWGYSEIPPAGGGGAAERERKRLEEKAQRQYPPAERPLYSPLPEPEPPEEDQADHRASGTALSVTSLVIGIVAVVLAAVFFYRSNVDIKTTETRVQQALTAVDELKHSGSPAPAALKIELMRTSRTLDAMAAEYQAEPETLTKIEELRNEVKELLADMEEKTPEAAPAGQATPAAPAAAMPEPAATSPAPATALPEPAPAPPAPPTDAAKQSLPPPAK